MIGLTASEAGTLFLLAQKRAQPSAARFCYPRFSRLITAAVLCGLWLLPRLASATGLSAYLALPSGHPVPNHVVRPNVTCLSPRASGQAFQAQASPSLLQARRAHAAESGS